MKITLNGRTGDYLTPVCHIFWMSTREMFCTSGPQDLSQLSNENYEEQPLEGFSF